MAWPTSDFGVCAVFLVNVIVEKRIYHELSKAFSLQHLGKAAVSIIFKIVNCQKMNSSVN